MQRRIEYSPRAIKDLDGIWDYIDRVVYSERDYMSVFFLNIDSDDKYFHQANP